MEKIVIVSLFGDLGIQLYQYTFIQFIEKYLNLKCIIDDLYFWQDGKSQAIDLESSCSVKLNKLSALFSEDIWREMIDLNKQGIPLIEQLYSGGIELTLVSDCNPMEFSGEIIYLSHEKIDGQLFSALANREKDIYFYGRFETITYLNLLGQQFFQRINFTPIIDTLEFSTINKRYEELIRLTDSIGVYYEIDLLNDEKIEKFNKYISNKQVEEGKTVFFIFSNDIEYCMENRAQLGIQDIRCDYFFIEENKSYQDRHIDMKLMALCKSLIISDCSFARWGYYLNSFCKEEKIIIVE